MVATYIKILNFVLQNSLTAHAQVGSKTQWWVLLLVYIVYLSISMMFAYNSRNSSSFNFRAKSASLLIYVVSATKE